MDKKTISEENGAKTLPFYKKFSNDLAFLIDYMTDEMTKTLPTLTIDEDYFVLAVFETANSFAYFIFDKCLTQSMMTDIGSTFYKYIESKTIKAIKPNRKPKFSDSFTKLIENAEKERNACNVGLISSVHLVMALLNPDNGENKISKILAKNGITYKTFKEKADPTSLCPPPIQDVPDSQIADVSIDLGSTPDSSVKTIFLGDRASSKSSSINKNCENLNVLASENKIDVLIGREAETEQLINALARKKKKNAIIVGGGGVGKTAICKNLATLIVNGKTPPFLLNKEVVSLNMASLVSGTNLRGQLEEKVQMLLKELKNNPKYILFIDDIGKALGHNGNDDYDFSAMIGKSLESDEIQVIGTADYASYRKTFDKNPSLARCFQTIYIDTPTQEEANNILIGLKPSYEKFHNVTYGEGTLETCVYLAKTYFTEKNLPDSAIDIMDEVGALHGLAKKSEELENARLRYEKATEKYSKIEKSSKKKSVEDIDNAKKEVDVAKKEFFDIAKKELDNTKKRKPTSITVDDILELVSNKTGIPISNLSSDEKQRLSAINERLKKEVIGQDNAIDSICKALKRNRIGLHKHGCQYSAMLLGQTGTGKTLIAKKLAKELFGTEDALVRIDMSEFSDKTSVNKLIGSNPGYVGYDEGGRLTELIKKKKFCVLLLDEIEKADTEVYNIFLPVLDEGFLTDNSGIKIDFNNVIVLFTSNVGVKTSMDLGKGIGFRTNEEENKKKILMKELKNRFPPEFLNRLDDVICFNSLNNDDLKRIIRLELNKVSVSVNRIGYSMSYDDSLVDFILKSIEGEKEYGARPIKRAIQEHVETAITDDLLENDREKGFIYKISAKEDKITVIN